MGIRTAQKTNRKQKQNNFESVRRSLKKFTLNRKWKKQNDKKEAKLRLEAQISHLKEKHLGGTKHCVLNTNCTARKQMSQGLQTTHTQQGDYPSMSCDFLTERVGRRLVGTETPSV